MSKQREILSLFRRVLKGADSFQDYSIRAYINRKAREEFSGLKELKNQDEVGKVLEHWRKELEVIKRQSVIQNLYFSRRNILQKE